MTMAPERWSRIRLVLERAFDLAPAERTAYLDHACAGDEDLRRHVRQLLEADEIAGSREREFLGTPALLDREDLLRDGNDEDGGSDRTARVDGSAEDMPGGHGEGLPYRILRKIGEGGMGIVYEAEQQNPRRSVALKVVRGGAYVDELHLRLFQRETQALARLRHPGIAAIYEAGRTDSGEHYFAMELVAGSPLDEYLRQRSSFRQGVERGQSSDPSRDRPEARARILLFLEICDAISYAHQRGVLHRDIKPSNIVVVQPDHETSSLSLSEGSSRGVSEGGSSGVSERGSAGDSERSSPNAVAMDHSRPGEFVRTAASRRSFQGSLAPSETPRIKVLDFGLARITDGDVALATMATTYRTIAGTLPYMSPEQARGVPEEIDVRADVYSLGVVLYEMLTGTLPYDVHGRSLPEALRMICETPARRPGASKGIWRGDLATIVLKALEKEPSRRYQSVSAFADDLRRYLADLPIQARPPSTIYQLRKLAARHRVAAALTSGLALALIAGAIGTTAGMVRARRAEAVARQAAAEAKREADTSEQVTRFLENLFLVSNPGEARGNVITAREILDRGVEQIEVELADQSLVRAQLLGTMGNVYRNLGLYDEARTLLERSLDARRETLGADHPEVARSLYGLAGLDRRVGNFGLARARYEEALAIREKTLGPDHPFVASSLSGLANLHLELGEYAQAMPLYERAIAITEKEHGPDHVEVAAHLCNFALLLERTGEFQDAIRVLERVVTIREKALGPDHPELAADLSQLGSVQTAIGEYDAAKATLERAIAIEEKSLGPDHAAVGESVGNLASLLEQMGDFPAARMENERALRILTTSLGEDHPRTVMARDALAATLSHLGDDDEALRLSRASLVDLKAALGPEHPSNATILVHLGSIHMRRGELASSRSCYEQALELRRKVLGPTHRLTCETLIHMAELAAIDDAAGAELLYKEALEMIQAGSEVPPRVRKSVTASYASLLRARGESERALEVERTEARTAGL